MIPLAEINHLSQSLKVAAETIEKDYVISWILLCLTQSRLKDNFVFYGGTAIKRVYFEEHRFSEDIDLFSTNKYSLNYILDELACLEYAQNKANLILEVNQKNIIAARGRAQLYVNYIGNDEIIGAPKEIRLDFSMDMEPYGTTLNRKVIETYSDLKNKNILLSVMSLNTIFANKLGLLFDSTRNEPRDLFDIWFLIQRLDKFDFDLNQVCNIFKEKFSFLPSYSILSRNLNNPSLKKSWNIRLGKQLSELPDIDNVIDDIEMKLKELFNQ